MDGDVVAVSDRDPVAVLVWEVEGVSVGEGDAVWDAEGVKEGVAVGVVLGAGLVLMGTEAEGEGARLGLPELLRDAVTDAAVGRGA